MDLRSKLQAPWKSWILDLDPRFGIQESLKSWILDPCVLKQVLKNVSKRHVATFFDVNFWSSCTDEPADSMNKNKYKYIYSRLYKYCQWPKNPSKKLLYSETLSQNMASTIEKWQKAGGGRVVPHNSASLG